MRPPAWPSLHGAMQFEAASSNFCPQNARMEKMGLCPNLQEENWHICLEGTLNRTKRGLYRPVFRTFDITFDKKIKNLWTSVHKFIFYFKIFIDLFQKVVYNMGIEIRAR